MHALLKRKQHWKNQEQLSEHQLGEINPDQMNALLDRALGMFNLLLSAVRIGGRIFWGLVRLAFMGRRLVRHQAPGVSEELNEYEYVVPPRLF